jgi:hypothetical protein
MRVLADAQTRSLCYNLFIDIIHLGRGREFECHTLEPAWRESPMKAEKKASQSHFAQRRITTGAGVARAALIAALILGALAAPPIALVAAQEGGGSQVDPLLGAVGLVVDSGRSAGGFAVPGSGSEADPLLGALGLIVRSGRSAGSSVALASSSDIDPLLGAVGLVLGSGRSAGGSVALGSSSDVDPLLGAVGLELGFGRSVALGSEVATTCSRPYSELVANPELAYVPWGQSC